MRTRQPSPQIARPIFDEPDGLFPPRRRWLKRISIGLVAVALLLAGSRWWWGWYAERQLDAEIASYRQRGEAVYIADFKQLTSPEASEVAAHVQRASELLTATSFSEYLLWQDISKWPAGQKDALRDWLRSNEAVPGQLRQARDISVPDGAADYSSLDQDPQAFADGWTRMRSLAAFFKGAMMLFHDGGNDRIALERCEDLLCCASVLQRRPALNSWWMSHAIQSYALGALWRMNMDPAIEGSRSGELTATRAHIRHLIARLQQGERPPLGWSAYYRTARATFLENLDELDHGRLRLIVAPGDLQRPASMPERAMSWVAKPYLQLQAVRTLRQLTRNADLPAPPSGVSVNGAPPPPPSMPGLPIVDTFMPMMRCDLDMRYLHLGLAQLRLAETVLAIRLYQVDHGGKWPAALNELAPAYLPAVPLDPCAADGRTIGYNTLGTAPVVYSVGMDGNDQIAKGTWKPAYAEDVEYGEYRMPDIAYSLVRLPPRLPPATLPAPPSGNFAPGGWGNPSTQTEE